MLNLISNIQLLLPNMSILFKAMRGDRKGTKLWKIQAALAVEQFGIILSMLIQLYADSANFPKHEHLTGNQILCWL